MTTTNTPSSTNKGKTAGLPHLQKKTLPSGTPVFHSLLVSSLSEEEKKRKSLPLTQSKHSGEPTNPTPGKQPQPSRRPLTTLICFSPVYRPWTSAEELQGSCWNARNTVFSSRLSEPTNRNDPWLLYPKKHPRLLVRTRIEPGCLA